MVFILAVSLSGGTAFLYISAFCMVNCVMIRHFVIFVGK